MQKGASRAVGVDNSAAMLHHAKRLAAEAGMGVELVQGTLGSVSKCLQLGMQLILKTNVEATGVNLFIPVHSAYKLSHFRLC